MTEAEWLSSSYTWGMIGFIRGRTGKVSLKYRLGAAKLERKQRLFLAACCRRIWPHLTDERSRRAVEAAERYADGAASSAELQEAHNAASAADRETRQPSGAPEYSGALPAAELSRVDFFGFNQCMSGMDVAALAAAARPVSADAPRGFDEQARAAEHAAQAVLIRDVFGNPFRPVRAADGWLTADVRALASRIYDEQAFDLLPILADALQDAGCGDEQLLDHCRDPGPHVRGCWAVDVLLGKG